MTTDKKIRVGITQGDTNGIGYEVIIKTLASPGITELFTPVVYGSSKILSYHRKALELEFPQINSVHAPEQIKPNAINIAELKKGIIDVRLTAPINKKTIQSSSFTFNGHTEYLESSIGDGQKALMILFNNKLRVALATTHLPISQISKSISKELIL